MDPGYGLGATPGVNVSVGAEWTSSLYFCILHLFKLHSPDSG